MKNTIDIRPIVANIVTRFANSVHADNVADIIMDLSHIGNGTNTIETNTLLDYLYGKLAKSNENMKLIYADIIAYTEYVSGKTVDKIINRKAIPLCQKRNLDICSMYCDGYDTSCEMYKSCEDDDDVFIGTCSRFEENDDTIAIEVCSFEEGDPQ